MGLADFDSVYATTDAKAGGGAIPDGVYTATLEAFELCQSSAGNDGLKFIFIIKDGPAAGRKLYHNRYVTHKTLAFVKADLATVGYAGSLADLEKPDVRFALTGAVVEVERKTMKDKQSGEMKPETMLKKLVSAAPVKPAGSVDLAPF